MVHPAQYTGGGTGGGRVAKQRKSRAASELGKKRWRGVSKEERSRLMRELVLRRWRKKSARSEER